MPSNSGRLGHDSHGSLGRRLGRSRRSWAAMQIRPLAASAALGRRCWRSPEPNSSPVQKLQPLSWRQAMRCCCLTTRPSFTVGRVGPIVLVVQICLGCCCYLFEMSCQVGALGRVTLAVSSTFPMGRAMGFGKTRNGGRSLSVLLQ